MQRNEFMEPSFWLTFNPKHLREYKSKWPDRSHPLQLEAWYLPSADDNWNHVWKTIKDSTSWHDKADDTTTHKLLEPLIRSRWWLETKLSDLHGMQIQNPIMEGCNIPQGLGGTQSSKLTLSLNPSCGDCYDIPRKTEYQTCMTSQNSRTCIIVEEWIPVFSTTYYCSILWSAIWHQNQRNFRKK